MEKNTVVHNTLPKTAWNSLSQAEKAEIIKVAVQNNITDLKTIRQKYNEFAEGGNIYDGTTMPTQQMQTDATYVNTPIAPVYFPVHQLPEVTVRPDSNLSPAERILTERARKQAHDRAFGKGSYDAYRRQEQTDYLIDKAARPTNVDRALDYAQALFSGIGQGADIASMTMGGLPVYSALKGSKALSEKDYVDGAIWMAAPMFGIAGKKAYDAVKPVIQRVFVKGTPVAKGAVGKTAPKIASENAASITPEQWTAAQDAAIARGDMAEAQRLRDLHFKVSTPNTTTVNELGDPIHNYHGTTSTFTAFDPQKVGLTTGDKSGFFFTDNKAAANFYSHETGSAWNNLKLMLGLYKGHKPQIYDVYLNTTKPMITDFHGGVDKVGREILAKEAIKNGNDANILQNIIDGPPALSHNVTIMRNPKHIKSADAVTYDNNGVRIPLGKRDNFNINDIRYGLLPFGIGLGALGTTYGTNQKALGGPIYTGDATINNESY